MAGEKIPETTTRTDLLIGMAREIGEHGGKIEAIEGRMSDQVRATQETGRQVQVLAGCVSDVKTDVGKLAKVIKKNGNGSVALGRGFWPKDFLGWTKVVGIGAAFIVGCVLLGGWLTSKGLLPGHEEHVEGIEVTAQPDDSLLIEIRRLNEYLSGRGGAAVTPGEPSWEMTGSDPDALAGGGNG